MSVTTEHASVAVGRSEISRESALPLWAWVLVSRVIVLASAAGAALFTSRYPGWAPLDPGLSTEHLGKVGNVLGAAVDRWDSIHYLQIAEHGYRLAGDTSFFPVYPLMLRALGAIVGSDVIAGVAISCACFAIGLTLLYRLVKEELGEQIARNSVLLLALAPLSFYFTAIYTESLFLALSVSAFYAARRERWWLAALLAAVDSATRVPGILVLAPVICMWWRSPARPRRALVWFALAPLPLIGFCLYLEARGFGLLAFIHNESTVYARDPIGPLGTILMAVKAPFTTPNVAAGLRIPLAARSYNLIELAVLGVALAALVGCWRRLPREYAIYATLLVIADLWSPLALTPMKSIDRYFTAVFPLWIAAAVWLRERRLTGAVLVVQTIALAFYVHQFARWSFVA